ncbi:MAG: hypothetical protein V4655_04695 [Bdellovibrionota bacterium]
MTHWVSKKNYAAMAFFMLALSCKDSSTDSSHVKSDWENAQEPDQTRTYVVDWSCEPKQYGKKAEKEVSYQEEYCEWKTVKTDKAKDEKTCRFTASFDTSRKFHLNSRDQTPFNTLEAALYLVESCADNATSRLEKGLGTGKLCAGLPDACVKERNSDPEICDKIRWTTKERFENRLDYCVDQLPVVANQRTEKPFLQFGLLTEIPANCQYTTDDKTELDCTVPAEESCFSVAGQLRVGLRVHTKPLDSKAELPSADACYQPLVTEIPEFSSSREISVPRDSN